MEKKIIGKGTWLDKVAYSIIEREKKLGRSLTLFRVESGLGASGFPHLGSLADAVRAYGVKLAIENLGHKAEYIAFSDDMDGLRKVPKGLPKSLEKHLGKPVTSIPDPFKCHESYGTHMSALLLDALDKCDVKYNFFSATNVYKKGLLLNEIEEILKNSEKIGEIIKEELSQEKYIEVLPYFPICANCGRIYTTKALEWFPKERKIRYICDGIDIRGKWIEGCKYEGEADYAKGEGKLSWKVEFAARWVALKINFEAYGKDIADSVRVNDRIMNEIFKIPSPSHVRYEMFLDKSGKKISKSTGNVFTPQLWLKYGSPQSLLLLMFKRITGSREISVFDIPKYMNEIDELEDIYFGKIKIQDKMEEAKLKGLYEYCWLLKPPAKPSPHIPYNLLAYLAKVSPKELEKTFIMEKLKIYGYKIDESSKTLEEKINYALNWVKDFTEIKEASIEISDKEKAAIKELIEIIKVEKNEVKLQSAIFEVAKKANLQPKDFFQLLYKILLGASQGPRLGPYIVAMGNENVVNALERALKSTEKPA
ncbi:MAG: lysine--tRNA ligase [Candidatus Bathyarchaeia archaeon]